MGLWKIHCPIAYCFAGSVLGIDTAGSGSSSKEDTIQLCEILAGVREMLREQKMFEAVDHI